jgi:hypothetical protein
VNIDLTSALSFWPARRACRRRQQDEPKLEEPGTVASHCLQADRSENRLVWLMRAGYFNLLQFFSSTRKTSILEGALSRCPGKRLRKMQSM